jgi:RimJ/RimL family protein N-acetyltransferase
MQPKANQLGETLPFILTERLRLVPPSAAHIPAHAAFYGSDRAAARGWSALPHEAWRNFAAILGHGLLRGFGPFVAEARDDGRPVGIFGPWWPEGQAEHEIKWTIWSASDEGRGFAAEGARACLNHAFSVLGWTTAVSYIAPDNFRSVALARRLGAVEDGTWTTPRGTVVSVFRHNPVGFAA